MTLVERFVQVGQWPTSRKTALCATILLPLHGLLWLAARWTGSHLDPSDFVLFDRIMVAWNLGLVVALALSLRAAVAGRDAPWTAYAFTVCYVAPLALLLGIFEDASVLAYTPALVLFIMVFFDERFGAVGLLCLVAPFLTGAPPLEGLDLLRFVGALEAGTSRAAFEYARDALDHLQFQMFIVVLVLSALAAAARRLQATRLAQAQRELQASAQLLERSNKLIRRYVPSQLAEQILSGSHGEDSRPQRRKLTIFFSDIEGFTDASDQLDPEELASILDEYLSEMTSIADRFGATINQLVGDGIMIFFGAPTATDDRDHALRAVRMALAMQARMRELREAWFRRGFQRPFQVRIGINTGFASVGDFGSAGRKLYSGIGLQTNLAARIQAKCAGGKVLISHATWALVHDQIPCADQGELQFRGVSHAIRVYEVLDAAAAAPAAA